ncbi:uncharacterized protein LOC132716926 [Ruditapes philippinarum]|uniref:uncharacterized protein LOC132716926 n=1 Tax=Ruditapes philippinarum TaxID=129788 RepID=UPI00295C27BB|nr:uncharacterized protein LOC132716926 [Ruditapes philippinarum]
MMEGVQGFLSRLDLAEHVEMFMAKGFDSEDDLPYLKEEDLDSMYITDHKARQKILQAAPHYKPSREYILYDWLRGKGLDHYFVSFIQSELIDLVDIARLNLPDEQLYDELEITLPGHKRRLERAVRSLAKKHKTSLPSFIRYKPDVSRSDSEQSAPITSLENELPVAYGRWGKPRCLVDAKYDFLILDATVVSTNDPRDRVHIEFMVDSGSDVVTLRQEVLDSMDLELIGPINSKGVHGSKVKNLYRANILIGNQLIEIEVMGESYDSIGSRVIRHFRHYINGARHIWLKGDFIDPTLPHKTHIPEKEITEIPVPPADIDASVSPVQETMQVEEVGGPALENSSETERGHDEGIENVSTKEQQFDKGEQVQKDFIKVDIVKEASECKGTTPTIDADKKIEFEFAKVEGEVDEQARTETRDVNEDNVDETDKILCRENEIIDIRPIIAANRKRHASNTGGVEPEEGIAKINGGRLLKKKKTALKNDSNVIETISDHMNGTCHIDKLGIETFSTVLNQRSVYYRSQVKMEGDGPS